MAGFSTCKKAVFAALSAVLMALTACGNAGEIAAFAPSMSQELFAGQYESGKGKVVISEIMSKNKTAFSDSSGDYPDWIEIQNLTDKDIDLAGWSLTDDAAKPGWFFPEFTLYADSRAVIFASKKDCRENGELHASFAVSEGETVYLRDRNGDTVSSVEIVNDMADRSYIPDGEGGYVETKYPTPGRENTLEAYAQLQNEKKPGGPVIINEVCVDGTPDWVEIKNVSSETVDLSRYYISDDEKNLKLFNFPPAALRPGEILVIDCTGKPEKYEGFRPVAPFGISSENARLYISDEEGNILDCLALRGIPAGCTYGRMDGENGGFYFQYPTAGNPNRDGKRFIAPTPSSAGRDGIFENVSSVTVELTGEGTIYYTTDGSLPNRESAVYMRPFQISSTCCVRAICTSPSAIDSSVLTLNYIINEGHNLPVACLATDDPDDFDVMYINKIKGCEVSGNISFYEDGSSFSANCGIKMNGFSTLDLAKKNLSLSFREKYGQSNLCYDLFGGGVMEFENLILRGGGDQLNTIVRSEACENLCMRFTDNVPAQRSRYCVLYINGRYSGIYAIVEKANEAHYASWADVSKGSVIINDATVEAYDEMYLDVIGYILSNDMSLPENYTYVCERLDIDSFIDWCVFQGWTGNNDLASGNLRYAMSPENGGKWQCMLFDLDAAFGFPANCMMNVIDFWNQVTLMNAELFKNAEYKDRFLTRAAEALSTVLTQENFLAEIDRLSAQIDSEVYRDSTVSGMSYSLWKVQLDMLRAMVEDGWNKTCTDNLCSLLELSSEERAHYFGDEN